MKMIIEIISDQNKKAEWNKIATHPMQSWEWGEARSQMGIDVVRFGVSDGTKLSECYQLTFHKIPYSPYTIGYLPRSKMPSKEVLEKIKEIALLKNCVYVKIEPYITIHDTRYTIHDTNKLVRSTHPLFPDWTQQLDLTRSEEELLNNCKPKTRYNIRLAQKKGVTVSVDREGDFEEFIKLYFETCKRQNYHGHNKKYHETIFEYLKDSISHILVAHYNGKPLCAYEVFLFNDILYYPYGGSSLEDRNVMAPNLLMWETILWGKRNGAKVFDMWGSLPPGGQENQQNDWGGFTRFKEGYDTEYVQFIGSFDLVINPSVYKLVNFLHGLRKKFL